MSDMSGMQKISNGLYIENTISVTERFFIVDNILIQNTQ